MQQGMPNNVSPPKFRVEPFSSYWGGWTCCSCKNKVQKEEIGYRVLWETHDEMKVVFACSENCANIYIIQEV